MRHITFALLLTLSLLLCSCGPAPTPPPDPVTIKFVHFGDESTEQYEMWAEAFHEENPWITVEIFTPGSDLTGTDVVAGSSMVMPYLLEQVDLLDLSSFIETDETINLANYGGTAELLTQSGEVLGLPSTVDLCVTYYNRDMFDAAGIAYPQPDWSWDDFVLTGSALRNRGAGEYGYVWGDTTLDTLLLTYSNGGWIADDLRDPTQPTLNSPAVVETLDWYSNLIYVHDIAPTQEQLRDHPFDGVVEIGIVQGKVGMWMGWISERGGEKRDNSTWSVKWKSNWGMAPPPTKERRGTLAYVSGFFMPSDAPHPDAGWEWISYLSKQTPQWGVPANTTILQSDEYERMVGEEVVALATTVLSESELLPPNLFEFESVLAAYGRAVETTVRGHTTAQEALDAAQEQATR